MRSGEKEEDEGYDVRDTGITKCHGRESGDKYGRLKVRMHAVVCEGISLRAEDDHLGHRLDKELWNGNKLDRNSIRQREKEPGKRRGKYTWLMTAKSCGQHCAKRLDLQCKPKSYQKQRVNCK